MSYLSFRGKSVYYGWVIAAALAAINMVAINMVLINYGLFITPMHEELGISHSVFGWGNTARWAGIGLSSLFIGRILDKMGTRRPLMIAAVLIFGSMMALSAINAGWQMLLIFVVLGAIGIDPIGSNLYAIVAIANWFTSHRGRAMSIVFLGLPIGIFFVTPLTQFLIDSIGWRDTMMILGAVGAGLIFLAALFVKNRAGGEEMPAAEVPADDEPENTPPGITAGEYAWTRSEAVRTPAFWKLSLSSGIFMFANGAVGVFRIPYYVSLGIDAQLVAFSVSIEALAAFLLCYPIGYAVGRFPLRHLLAITLVAKIVFFVLVMNMTATATWLMFLCQIIFGFAIQGRLVIESTLWPNYFGERNIGSIRGFSMPLIMGLGLIGAPLAGMAYDSTGSYFPVWWVAVALLVVSTVLIIATPKPAPPRTASIDNLNEG